MEIEIFIITFDIAVDGDSSYDEIEKKMDSLGVKDKVAKSSYILKTDRGYDTVVNDLISITNDDDNLFIGKLTGDAYQQFEGNIKSIHIEALITGFRYAGRKDFS